MSKRDWTEEFDRIFDLKEQEVLKDIEELEQDNKQARGRQVEEGAISSASVIFFLTRLKSQGVKLKQEQDTNKKLDLLASMLIIQASITTLNSDVSSDLSAKLKGLVSAFL